MTTAEPEPEPAEPENGAEILAAHLKDCVKADAAIVVDGNGDAVIATLLAAGWTWDGNAEIVAGKRVRSLVPPPEVAARLAAETEVS